MKLVYFNNYTLGVMKNDKVVDVSGIVEEIPHVGPHDLISQVIERFEEYRPQLEAGLASSDGVPLDQVRLRAPLPKPGKILCMAGNYLENGTLKEARPINAFLKNRNAVIGDGDTVVLPNAVEAMLGVLKRSADIGIVGCRLLNPDKTPQQSFGSVAGFIGDLIQSTFSNTLFANSSNPIVEKILARLHRSGKKVGWVCGACMLCRRDSLEETGLLDENFFMYKEDMDLCISFRKKNWGIYYTPDAPIIHHLGASVSAKPFETAIEYRKSQLYFYKKHYGWMGLLCLKIYLYGKFIRKLSVSFLVDCAGEPSSGNGQDSYSLNREILKVIRDFH